MEQRLPFNLIDETAFHGWSRYEPLNVQLEIRLGGSLDFEPLERAVSKALQRHPRARARLAPWSACQRGFQWIIDREPMGDPMEVVDGASHDLDETRASFYGQAIAFDRSPQLRVLLYRSAGGDRLLLSCHHACGDGIGALRFLRSVARAYAGREDPVPPMLPVTLKPRLGPDLWKALSCRGVLLDASWGVVRASPPSRIASEGGEQRRGYAMRTAKCDEVELDGAPGASDATVNDRMIAALHLAIDRWNATHGGGRGHIAVFMPVNARPQSWRHEILGNFLLAERISTTRLCRRTRAAALRAVLQQTRRAKEKLGAVWLPKTASLGAPIGPRVMLAKRLPAVIDPFSDSAVLSNLGRVSVDDLAFGKHLVPTEIYFSPPARMPIGVSIGACGLGDEWFISLRYCHAQFSKSAASDFTNSFLDEFDALVAPDAG